MYTAANSIGRVFSDDRTKAEGHFIRGYRGEKRIFRGHDFLCDTQSARAAPTRRRPFGLPSRIASAASSPSSPSQKVFSPRRGSPSSRLRFSSGPACAEALYSGAADIGGMGDTTAIIMTARSPAFVIIASHATGEHRHRVMVRNDSRLQTLNDLKGKRLGVKKGTSTYGGLLAALSKAGMAAR